MTAALTPDLALAYLTELSADIRAVMVLGADGRHLAGPEALSAPARALAEWDTRASRDHPEGSRGRAEDGLQGLAETDREGPRAPADDDAQRAQGLAEREPRVLVGGTSEGRVFLAGDRLHTLVVVTGPLVLNKLLLHDLRRVLVALGGGIDAAPPKTAPEGLIEAIIEALERRV